MESFLLRKKTRKSYFESLMSYAPSSQASYKSALNRFEEFCDYIYNGRTADQIVNELKSIPLRQRDDAYFGVLQGYVNWLLKRQLSHKTVNNHFKIVNHYFSFHGIRAFPSDLRRNVNRPKEIKEKLHPLTLEEIYKLFAYSPLKRRMLYLVLIGSGMRIRECVSLRKKDFELGFLVSGAPVQQVEYAYNLIWDYASTYSCETIQESLVRIFPRSQMKDDSSKRWR